MVTSGRTKKVDRDRGESDAPPLPTSLLIDGNVQLNRVLKKAVKKNKRAARKQGTRPVHCRGTVYCHRRIAIF